MELDLYQLDAFTDAVFGGNPAAVVPLQEWLPTEFMQALGAENNLSETAFFVPTPGDADHDFHIRWFTPGIEAQICGHATLATAAVLFEQLGWEAESVRFKSMLSSLKVTRRGDVLELDFPVLPRTQIQPADGLEAALGAPILDYYDAQKNLAVLETAAAVRSLTPDMRFLKALGKGVIVTAEGEDCDFVSRYFAPYGGIPEDPVTGSAHCVLVPYWAERLGKQSLHARQVSQRGGELYCTLSGDRVLIAGKAAMYMKGIIYVGDGGKTV